MGWLELDPDSLRHILITHQDTDHVGALENDSEQLFRNATVYIGEIENRYLTGEVRRKVFHGFYRLPMVKSDNRRELLRDGQVFSIGDIKIECILVPGHTWGHMVYLIDDQYLFTGDTIWFGADGGYSFISTLAEDNRLAVQSLEKLEKNIRSRKRPISVITGHTGWTDDLDFVFAHRGEFCAPLSSRQFCQKAFSALSYYSPRPASRKTLSVMLSASPRGVTRYTAPSEKTVSCRAYMLITKRTPSSLRSSLL